MPSSAQVKFDEYRELYTVPLNDVIPRMSTHEENDESDIAAVYKRRRREDKEQAAQDAAQADEEEDNQESSKGVVTAHLSCECYLLKSNTCCDRNPDAQRRGGCLGAAHTRHWFTSDE